MCVYLLFNVWYGKVHQNKKRLKRVYLPTNYCHGAKLRHVEQLRRSRDLVTTVGILVATYNLLTKFQDPPRRAEVAIARTSPSYKRATQYISSHRTHKFRNLHFATQANSANFSLNPKPHPQPIPSCTPSLPHPEFQPKLQLLLLVERLRDLGAECTRRKRGTPLQSRPFCSQEVAMPGRGFINSTASSQLKKRIPEQSPLGFSACV